MTGTEPFGPLPESGSPTPPDIAEALLADLEDLAQEVAGETTASSISMLRRDLRLAVRSLLGFSVTLTTPGLPTSVAINVFDAPLHPGDAADTITLPLPAQPDGSTASMVIYAAEPHALDAVREDLAYALDLPPAALTPVLELQVPVVPGVTGLDRFSVIHRAIGVLIETGHTQETAVLELVRQAHTAPAGIHGAARALLRQAVGGRTQGQS